MSASEKNTSSALRHSIQAGDPIGYWRVSPIVEARYDTEPATLSGNMDAQFFLTKEKNFIPHEYPCRTQFLKERRGKRPVIREKREPSRIWLPFGSPRVDLSGFWFRATEVAAWAETVIEAESAGTARLSLSCCGGAILWVNGREVGEMSTYQRNFETAGEFDVSLQAGLNEIKVFFDDLAERDARYFFQLTYLNGPDAVVALPVPCTSALASEMERLLDLMHFEEPSYSSGTVAFVCPVDTSEDLDVTIVVEGDFLAEEKTVVKTRLAKGERRLVVGPIESFHSDFRHFDVHLSAFGFEVARPFTVEVAHCDKQGNPPSSLSGRVQEALDHVSHNGYPDAISALARLANGLGDETTAAMILNSLPRIEECFDCADFHLVPLLFGRIRYGHLLSEALRQRIDKATIGFRYWLDEPGNDVQWYYSENHALLFHTAAYLAGAFHSDKVFARSGRLGAEQSRVGAERLRVWFDHFEKWEMAEFNSVPYFPIDLKGLTTLYALAHDDDIKMRAGNAIQRLIRIVAASSHGGMLTGAQGRSYEHTLMAARTSELSAIARVLWSRGWYGRCFQTLPQFLICLREDGLVVPEELRDMACLAAGEAQEWIFSQGENRFAHLYHYKTHDTAMGSLARYRWNEWGYQETVLQLRLGGNPDAQIWLNHPGEVIHAGFGRPSYWGGCGTLPRLHQYRNLAIVLFETHEGQPEFSHIWFPRKVFDEALLRDGAIAARSDDGLVQIRGWLPLEPMESGPTAGTEIRQHGRKTAWVIRVGTTETDGSLNHFSDRFVNLNFEERDDGHIVVDDPEYGRVEFEDAGTIRAEGRVLDPASWTVEGAMKSFTRTSS